MFLNELTASTVAFQSDASCDAFVQIIRRLLLIDVSFCRALRRLLTYLLAALALLAPDDPPQMQTARWVLAMLSAAVTFGALIWAGLPLLGVARWMTISGIVALSCSALLFARAAVQRRRRRSISGALHRCYRRSGQFFHGPWSVCRGSTVPLCRLSHVRSGLSE